MPLIDPQQAPAISGVAQLSLGRGDFLKHPTLLVYLEQPHFVQPIMIEPIGVPF